METKKMIVNHSDDGGEIHSRYDDQRNHIEWTTITPSGAMFTFCFSKGNFNELVKTARRLSEAFDEGRHERDVQRWIDWAEENRGSPKLKAYIEGKANALIEQTERTINVAVDTSNRISPNLVERFRDMVAEHGDGFTGSLFTEEEQAKMMKDGGWILPRTFVPINPADLVRSDTAIAFDDDDPQMSDEVLSGAGIADIMTDKLEAYEQACAWEDIEEYDELVAIRSGPVRLSRGFTLYEAMMLPRDQRMRIAAALVRSEGAIVFDDK